MDMEKSADMACTPYREGEPSSRASEVAQLLPQVPRWQIVEREGLERLERVLTFNDFADALVFANKVGALAGAENHHPAILVEWRRTTVTWWTHMVRGLHCNDFVMAAKVDRAHTGK
jgi:4a-hydroxytetrahydrobiopterin dehydratase